MILGKYETNTIYNEDCYLALKNIPDKSIDCIYTDVPYEMQSGGKGGGAFGNRIYNLIRNDMKDIIQGFDYSILNEFVRVMKKINIFIWCKPNATPFTNNVWLTDIEYCLYFREKGIKLNDGYELKSKYYVAPTNKFDKDLYNHPTIKPLELVKRHLLHATQSNDIVLDPFMGSGTTAVACKETERNFIGFEINKEYYKVAIDRVNGITANGQTTIFTDFNNIG